MRDGFAMIIVWAWSRDGCHFSDGRCNRLRRNYRRCCYDGRSNNRSRGCERRGGDDGRSDADGNGRRRM